MLARDQFWTFFRFLRFVAVAAQLVDAQVGMRPVGRADRGRCPRNLLDRNAMLEVPEPRAAILLLDGNAVQAELADFRPEVAGKLIALVDLVGARRNLVAREIVHGLADSVRGFAEIEVEHPVRVWDHGRAASGQSCGFLAHRLMLWKQACHGPKLLRRGHCRNRAPVRQKGTKLSLALAGATGCNSLNNHASEANHGGGS